MRSRRFSLGRRLTDFPDLLSARHNEKDAQLHTSKACSTRRADSKLITHYAPGFHLLRKARMSSGASARAFENSPPCWL